MISDESEVQELIRVFLKERGWLVYGGKSGIDVRAEREYAGVKYLLLGEVKGDVGPHVANPVGQRLKYVQHAIGQLLLRTRQYAFGSATILGLGFPSEIRDDPAYFPRTLRDGIADTVRRPLNLTFFFVAGDRSVTVDVPDSVPSELFVSPSKPAAA